MQIILNGKPYFLENALTLDDLVKKLNCQVGSIAIAVNQNIIPHANYLEYWLAQNDQVEIVTAFQGG